MPFSHHSAVEEETRAALATLRRLARPLPRDERCEFCSAGLAPDHRHLLEIETRKIICACDPCALRFQNVVAGRWKLIPRDARPIPDLQFSDEEWESLSLPINLAFFFHSTRAGRIVAMYPSPAGATESLLPLASWETLVSKNPRLGQMAADVEALLVNRLGATPEYYLTPIDVCFALAGLIRVHWRGFSGGDAVWKEIEGFFARLRTSSPGTPVPEVSHA